jgi:hypothetical protein
MLALQGYYRINKSNHEATQSKLELKRRIASKQAKENQNNYEIFVLTGSNLNTSCSNEGQIDSQSTIEAAALLNTIEATPFKAVVSEKQTLVNLDAAIVYVDDQHQVLYICIVKIIPL